MKLFLIEQSQNLQYDTYDSAVVAAPDEETARNMSPEYGEGMASWKSHAWCNGPEHVSVKFLGEAAEGIVQGVICASFDAG